MTDFTVAEKAAVREIVSHYRKNVHQAELAVKIITALYATSKELGALSHSTRSRVKTEVSLERKLFRKLAVDREAGQPLSITCANLFEKITDCAGFRILHLHTAQFADIHRILLDILGQQRYVLAEKPFARVWDLEYREYFKKLDLEIQDSDSYYTSVHYVVDFNSGSGCKCEIQVRTLAEELWGEVDHSINYPDAIESVACREQIKALARVTSSCTRLVDAIFASYDASLPKRRTKRMGQNKGA